MMNYPVKFRFQNISEPTAMLTEIVWQGKCQFEVNSEDDFTFTVDADSKIAPCPTEVLLSALGTCSATDVVEGIQSIGGKIKSLKNQLSYTLTKDEPQLYKSVNLHFVIDAKNITEKQIDQVVREGIRKTCHVCLMLQSAIEISYTVDFIET